MQYPCTEKFYCVNVPLCNIQQTNFLTPRRQVLSISERERLFAIPQDRQQIILLYSLSSHELSLIRKYSRGASNRIGFGIQACYMKYSGMILPAGQLPDVKILDCVCEQLKLPMVAFKGYGQQVETRRDHLLLLRTALGFKTLAQTGAPWLQRILKKGGRNPCGTGT